jgi:quinol monooxygenase YgiN
MRTTGDGGAMSEPIVFMSHHRIKPGEVEALKALTAEIWSAMETEKPRTLMNLAYLNEDGTEVTFMHAFADIEAMQLHWQGADERAKQAYEYVEPIGFEIYGSAGDQIVEGMRAEAAGGGATLTIWPEFVTGFLRLRPG